MFCYCVGGGGVLLPTEPGLHRTSAQNACLVRQGVAPTAYVGLCAYVLHRYKRFLSQYRCFFRRFDIFRKSTETCCSLSIPGPPMC
ncbi:hypothetical protein HZ326_15345 [Fusarium oxysporum f. sp. albedinis]|nr:hypothetical protein HZ326_15345 [Fusarium oxysporum f. sp. albedinis]